ncbi:TfoX/Sxy family protein [Glycomyces albidus]|jgi:TfoX/Sxy family transcriptional regulator of competence genes|uniref:RNA methyltransferase n=1 Tax=Glycomyces albidus TaxID=2656774 RepID=A0A6L5G8V6_9ACTN|nr:TfoX/Sxy family protein [Glycomyces albidus]MQM26013.1 RNA methyltransferase [Glycomyces albidus]
MAYDEALAERIRDAFDNRPYVVERKMFGGLGWMVHGNMAAAALGSGGAMVRVGKDDYEDLIAEPGAEPMVMSGRTMTGWIRLGDDACASDVELRTWIGRGIAFAETLPRK